MSIRRDLLLRTALLRLPDPAAVRAIAPAVARGAAPAAGAGVAAAPRPATLPRRTAARTPKAG
jgi:hypothetical protein